MPKREMKTTDYIYCKDCKQFVDLWKYDSFEDTGHKGCDWRFVTKKELKECISECKKDGCFQERKF